MATPSPSTAPFTTSPPAPSTTSSGNGNGIIGGSGGNGPPTSLYLYTFVATLSLLFAIFGTLVVRSVRLRRRRNAAILAAIANGTYVPAAARGGKPGDAALAPKPRLWEAHLAPPDADVEKGWGGVFPVAASTFVLDEKSPAPQAPPRTRGWWARLRRAPAPPAPTPDSALPAPAAPPAAPEPPVPMQLAVLVAMPSPRAEQHASGYGAPPVVEFGIASAEYARSAPA
ncbi:hypothetical protein BC834DRAFT_967254 [Gloeopeniophorella convolvens]|nr:hypothetical protein BC834DRAFT_967254 [Gloeopeniophorella convolvens]